MTLSGTVAAHAAAPATTSGSTTAASTLTDAQASAQAVSTGTAVPVTGDETSTQQVTANPDGSFTLDQSVAPARKRVDGTWSPLDATLAPNSDGTVSPRVATYNLALSGGGTAPLAVLHADGTSLALNLPSSITSLPTPTLSGATATYANVLAGVNLIVTADEQGGFSEVFEVTSATAAANPALRSLTFPTKATGVTVSSDSAGNISATDQYGRALYNAPAPRMWDSQTAATVPAADAAKSLAVSRDDDTTGGPGEGSGEPATSSASGPGADAKVESVQVSTAEGAIDLTPDASLLASSSTDYPVYIDPTYSAGGTAQSWAMVESYYPTTAFWKQTGTDAVHVGDQAWESPYTVDRAFVQLPFSSKLYGAQDIKTAYFYADQTYSASCTQEPVHLWWTGAISNLTTWNHQPSWISDEKTLTVAHGWSSSCPAAQDAFDIKALITQVLPKDPSNLTLGLRAGDEGNKLNWEKFNPATMKISVTYDHAPDTPSNLWTTPGKAGVCTGQTLGNGDITLNATVSDPDKSTVTAHFKAWKSGTSTTIATGADQEPSGKNAVFKIPMNTLDTAAGNGTMGVSWSLTVSDDNGDGSGGLTSATSKTCSFTYDPSHPGAPTLTDSAGADCDNSTVQYQVGVAASFTAKANSTGVTPAKYVYQLNSLAPTTASAASGALTFSIKPTRQVNTLTVTAESPGGNIGDATTCIIAAAPPQTAAEGDLTDDGSPDLIAVGGRDSLPSGLWMNPGQSGNGAATDIGALGTGVSSNGSPGDWNGTTAITGHFTSSGTGFNDVLDYLPGTSTIPATAVLRTGSGDGSALTDPSQTQDFISGIFTDDSDPANYVNATSVSNGGNLSANTLNTDYPGSTTNQSLDLIMNLDGYLWLLPNGGDPTAFSTFGEFNSTSQSSDWPLSATSPTGGNWTGWTVSTTVVSGSPVMFARNNSTGQLSYYNATDLQDMAANGCVDADICGTINNGMDITVPAPAQLATTGWSATSYPDIEAANISSGSQAGLWGISPSGAVTTATLNTAGTTLTTGASRPLSTMTNQWPLTDGTGSTTAVDNAGSDDATLSSTGTTWSTDSTRGGFLSLNGSTGYASSSTPDVATDGNFSISAWVNLSSTSANSVFVTQGDNPTSPTAASFQLYYSSYGAAWAFGRRESAANGSAFAAIYGTGGQTVTTGTWTHLIGVFNASANTMQLYVNGKLATSGAYSGTNWASTGALQIGRGIVATSPYYTQYTNGGISDVRVFNQALNAAQAADLQ
ncbi:LamG-like jellyroll fold domain-containing protein [Streptacidiphilus sp. N1-3]|uniref:LamG-like jellyroll fold domain-containing protein n=1 Tax=Streptacidiphilus alkalitolerans TaxID=3342712 RepID=A0ABV6X322_9ACTN